MRFYFKPFLIHLAVSVLIALVCYWLIFLQWYPEPFQATERVLPILLILLAVDVVVGPLLTLLVYKPEKKDLVFDMAVIVILQVAALSFGIWKLSQARPAWLVFSVDRFELVRQVDIDERRIVDAAPEFRSPALFGPSWVVADLPQNPQDRQALLFESISGGSDIANRPELFASLEDRRAVIEQAILPLDQLVRFNDPEQVQRILHQYPEANGWIPMTATHETLVVLMNRASVQVVAVVRLEGFE
jgi:hypothetical protein